MTTRISAFLFTVALAYAGLGVSRPADAQGRRPLFVGPARGAAADHAASPAHGRPTPRRSRQVTLEVQALAALDTQSGTPQVELNLFDDVVLTADVEHYETRGPGSFTWKGRLRGMPAGHATFVATDGVVAGTVFAEGAVFEVTAAGNGLYDVRELDPAAFPSDDPPSALDLVPATGEPATGESRQAVGDSAAQIDVMVVWTPAAESASGGAAAMRSLVDLAVSNANTAYAHSGISTRLRLVYKGQVAYAESSIGTDLSRLTTTNDGFLDPVHTLRNQYGADIVSLFGTGYANAGACGIGYLMGSVSTSFAPNAFNVVDYSCAAGNLSFAHEVGHNEGMHHDPANAGGAPAYAYSYGYVDPSCAFRTVMAYGGCLRVTQFSSPNVLYNGRVTGTATQNNALTLNNTAATVANFRQATSTCSYSLSPSSWAAPAGGGSSSVNVTASGSGCSWTATSSAPSWLTITSGASGSVSGTVSFAASANPTQSARSATITAGGKTFTVNQAAGCGVTVTPSTLSSGAEGGNLTLSVSSGSGCGWTASSGAGWITVTTGATGSGTGTVSLNVSANTSTSSSRTGSLTVAGKTVSVTQAASTAVRVRSFTASRAYPLQAGQLVTWTANASGGVTALQYQYWRYSAKTAAWTIVRDWSTDATFSWVPQVDEAGSYAVQVWVRQTGSTAKYDAWAGTPTFAVKAPAAAPVTVSSLVPSVALPKPAGTTITWSAKASGGSGSLEYEFWLYNGKAWSIARAYGPSNQFSWTPAVAGSYVLQVWVRQVGSSASYDAWLGSGFVTITSALTATVSSVTLAADRAMPVSTGTAVTWTGNANASTVEYEFWLYDGSAWQIAQPYGPSSTLSWTPSAPGRYALQVWVRMIGSIASYQAWASSGLFTVSQ
jgi:hypothetical protein